MAEAEGARATLECRWVGCEGTERQLIAFKSSDNVYAFVYALLIQVLELRTPKCDNSRTDGAPSGGRTHTGRILSPPRETPGFQNLEDLSVAQAQVLGILRNVYAFMYAFLISGPISRLHRLSDGQGILKWHVRQMGKDTPTRLATHIAL